MFLPVIYHQALFAPGEALSAMGIEKSITPQLHAGKSNRSSTYGIVRYTLPDTL
jgi:hypothetical protein